MIFSDKPLVELPGAWAGVANDKCHSKEYSKALWNLKPEAGNVEAHWRIR
jgi:hypothetical protein